MSSLYNKQGNLYLFVFCIKIYIILHFDQVKFIFSIVNLITYNFFPRPVCTSLSSIRKWLHPVQIVIIYSGKKPDNRGYFRFSLENSVHHSSQTASDVLSQLTGADFTPIANKSRGQFLCPECWSKLNDTVRYQQSLDKVWEKTQDTTYISQKRKNTTGRTSPEKRARYASTPLHVSIYWNRRGITETFMGFSPLPQPTNLMRRRRSN